jgi:DNA mismatch repair protein MutS
MAQIGSFVPAKSAHVGLVDRVFTRVGGADDISRGASTFMVEMTETANILNNATRAASSSSTRSAAAPAPTTACRWRGRSPRTCTTACAAAALFATHYHQLMDLAGPGRGIVNCRVAVREWGDEIVFLHRIEQGGTDRSYGLHVARLAGIPKPVLDRARHVLQELDDEGSEVRDKLVTARDKKPGLAEGTVRATARPGRRRTEGKLDLDDVSPRQALELLRQWQERSEAQVAARPACRYEGPRCTRDP